MVLCEVAQTAVPSAARELGAKPPWNQPHVSCLEFSRSPTFLPVIITCVRFAIVQSSSAAGGRASPISDPPETMPLGLPAVTVRPCVVPEITFNAPGVEGPNTVEKELSLIAKFCA